MGAERLELHPDDASAAGLCDGDTARVASRRGTVEVTVEVTDRVAPGQCFMAFHFPETPANVLTSDHTDTGTSCPEYKVTAVRVSSR